MDSTPIDATYRYTHLLGTVIDVRVRAAEPTTCERAAAAVVDEIVRLEAIFTVFDRSSELNRWKRDEVPDPSADLVAVMSAALEWQHRSDGAFNPMSGVLSDLWRRAVEDQIVPSPTLLADAAASIAAPRFEVADGVVRRLGNCMALNLNAIAKGYIVDRATAAARSVSGVEMILVSAGGDLLHAGHPTAPIGIANPLRPYDNEPPVAVIDLADAGLATSGGSRRGVLVGGHWFSHVIDPRTGQPVTAQASVTVVARTAMHADVLATVLGLDDPATAVAASESEFACSCLVIGHDGGLWANSSWIDAFGTPMPATSG